MKNLEEIRAVLDDVAAGRTDIEAALQQLSEPAVAETDFATIDLERATRCGFPEVIFAQGKSVEWLLGTIMRIVAAGQSCLATRLDSTQSEQLRHAYPQAELDLLARTFWLPHEPVTSRGFVAIVTAGTTDLPVAREALVTARALGCSAELIVDVGVAGLHRLLRRRIDFEHADAVVVVAGMDGALPSVVGGLVACPVIAVPTSVGYGTAFGGLAPLLTMLNSCSANVVAVNIDAGFKAGYVAGLIARRSEKGR